MLIYYAKSRHSSVIAPPPSLISMSGAACCARDSARLRTDEAKRGVWVQLRETGVARKAYTASRNCIDSTVAGRYSTITVLLDHGTTGAGGRGGGGLVRNQMRGWHEMRLHPKEGEGARGVVQRRGVSVLTPAGAAQPGGNAGEYERAG